mmetsp:Transcript_10857/g.37621  ORF Transcript_10857/g.37621 Transcript_10857/m.37621 type:complete len:248 (-) Transcript_10857:71-814(-)
MASLLSRMYYDGALATLCAPTLCAPESARHDDSDGDDGAGNDVAAFWRPPRSLEADFGTPVAPRSDRLVCGFETHALRDAELADLGRLLLRAGANPHARHAIAKAFFDSRPPAKAATDWQRKLDAKKRELTDDVRKVIRSQVDRSTYNGTKQKQHLDAAQKRSDLSKQRLEALRARREAAYAYDAAAPRGAQAAPRASVPPRPRSPRLVPVAKQPPKSSAAAPKMQDRPSRTVQTRWGAAEADRAHV